MTESKTRGRRSAPDFDHEQAAFILGLTLKMMRHLGYSRAAAKHIFAQRHIDAGWAIICRRAP